MSAFGHLLRRARLSAGLSQQDLAERSGVSVRQISYLESGRTRKPYRRTVQLLADALKLDDSVRADLENAARAAMKILASEMGHPAADTAPSEAGGIVQESSWYGESRSATTWPVPVQLPHNMPGFTGRAVEMATLTKLREQSTGTSRILAIDGAAGIGKTTLAVHWAHHAASWFPDGQLYINLRGFDPSGKSVTPSEAIGGFLDALAAPLERRPVSLDARTALYRSLLAGRRMLIVLDNAYDEQQVRPLLPGNPESLTLVTSRRQLGGLVAFDGARIMTLDPLTEAEARDLLAGRLGAEQIAAEPQAVGALTQFCAGLPLALAVTAARAATWPGLSLAELAAQLNSEAERLDVMDVGDTNTSVRAAFSWSYRYLRAASARLFCLLALHPGPDITVPAAASLASTSLARARDLLTELTQVSLLRRHAPGRYAFHDLVRAYARELAGNKGQTEQDAALSGLFDYYLHTAAAAMDVIFPAEKDRRPRVAPPAESELPITDPKLAAAWLDAERTNLIAAAHAAINDWPRHTTRLAATLFRYLDAGGHFSEAITIHGAARDAASRTGDRAAEAVALTNLGVVDIRLGVEQRAIDHLQQALSLYPGTSDRVGHARALHNLALVYHRLGRVEAVDLERQALYLHQEAGDRIGQVRALSSLGTMETQDGRYEEAMLLQQQALALSRELGDRSGEAYALAYIGELARYQRRYRLAETQIQQALILFREIGDRNGEAGALADLGATNLRQGHHPQAEDHFRQALAVYREIGDPNGQAEAFNGLGELFLATGLPARALDQHTTALDLASRAGSKYQEARAHSGLNRAYQTVGDHGQACQHKQRALALYTELGINQI
jgi:tetratricopeptide (TPR) repeat protein/transcriptional regulator with XRE-family HTH domain